MNVTVVSFRFVVTPGFTTNPSVSTTHVYIHTLSNTPFRLRYGCLHDGSEKRSRAAPGFEHNMSYRRYSRPTPRSFHRQPVLPPIRNNTSRRLWNPQCNYQCNADRTPCIQLLESRATTTDYPHHLLGTMGRSIFLPSRMATRIRRLSSAISRPWVLNRTIFLLTIHVRPRAFASRRIRQVVWRRGAG